MSMPNIPSLTEIYDRICTDIELYLPDANARAEESLLSTLAAATSGVTHELYQFLKWIIKQVLPDTADEEVLLRWANLLNVTRLNGELLDSWRARIAAALQERSRIGDADDYVRWAKAASSDVTHAWVVVGGDVPLGDIHIYCVTGNLSNPIPSPELLATVTTFLDRIRNVCGRVVLLAPLSKPISVQIAGDINATTQVSIESELKRLFARKYYSTARLLEAEIHAAIQKYTLDYTLYSPSSDITAKKNELITLGDVKWLA